MKLHPPKVGHPGTAIHTLTLCSTGAAAEQSEERRKYIELGMDSQGRLRSDFGSFPKMRNVEFNVLMFLCSTYLTLPDSTSAKDNARLYRAASQLMKENP